MPQAHFKLYGLPEALQALESFPRELRNRWYRIALNAAGGVLKKSAQASVRTQTKLLKKSLGVKVKVPNASRNPKHRSRPAYAIIGPRRGFLAPVARVKGKVKKLGNKTATKRVLAGGKVRVRNPTRYSHLVEKSHVVKRGGRVVGRTRPHPFLSTAVQRSGQESLDKATAKLDHACELVATRACNRQPALA